MLNFLSGRNGWRRPVVLATLAFALLITLNPRIGFGNGTGCDSWYFFGIYRQYFEAAKFWGGPYQLERYGALLPWIYIDPLLNGIDAAILRMSAYFLITIAAFSYAVHRLFAPAAAVVSLLLFALSKFYLGDLSTDYVSPAGTMWAAVLIAVTVHVALSPKRSIAGPLMCGGIAMCGIATHLPMALFIFSTPLLFFAAPQHWSRDGLLKFVRFCAIYLVGAAIGFAALGAYSVSLGNEFIFLRSGVSGGLDFFARYRANKVDWSWAADDANVQLLGVLSVGAVACLVSLIKPLRAKDAAATASAAALIVFLLMSFAIFAWESLGLVALRDNVYAPFLYPVAFLGLGAILNSFIYLRDVTGAVLLAFASVLTAILIWTGLQPITTDAVAVQPIFAIALLCSAIALAALFSKRRISAVICCLALIALIASAYPPGYGREAWNSDRSWRGSYEEADAANDFMTGLHLDRNPKFWVASEDWEPMVVPRTYLRCSDYPASFPSLDNNVNQIGSYFPAMRNVASTYLVKDDVLIVIGNEKDLTRLANAALAPLGISLQEIAKAPLPSRASRARYIAATRVIMTRPAT